MRAFELSGRHVGQTVAWTVVTDDEPDVDYKVQIGALRTHTVTGAVEVTDPDGQVHFLPTEWPVTVSP